MTEEFEVGDIVWAKVGKFPYWPSIICNDPLTNVHVKKTKKKGLNLSFHVRFCNDNIRRNWATNIEKYFGKDELLAKHSKSIFKMSNRQFALWNYAVLEADKWLKFDKQTRIEKFENGVLLYIEIPENKSAKSATKTTTTCDSFYKKYWKKDIIKRAEEDFSLENCEPLNNNQIIQGQFEQNTKKLKADDVDVKANGSSCSLRSNTKL